MRDRYLESFIGSEENARVKLARYSRDYRECGMYPCAGGFVVWADSESEIWEAN